MTGKGNCGILWRAWWLVAETMGWPVTMVLCLRIGSEVSYWKSTCLEIAWPQPDFMKKVELILMSQDKGRTKYHFQIFLSILNINNITQIILEID